MTLLHISSAATLAATFAKLGTAFLLGAVIGLERQMRQRTAGLRTNTLVAVGAAIFVTLGAQLFEMTGGPQTPIHVVAYVVSGIGFLGAGAIMKEGASISGLNTAATLWGSGAVGACCGAGLLAEAAMAACFVLASNTLLRPLVNRINRQPFHEASGEATYTVYAICARAAQADVRERLLDMLEAASYPVRQIDEHPFGNHEVEISLTLYATAVQVDEMDAIIAQAETLPGLRLVFWNAGDES